MEVLGFDASRLYPRTTELDDGRSVDVYQSEIGDVGCVVWDAAIVLAKFYEHLSTIKPNNETQATTEKTINKCISSIRSCNAGDSNFKVIELGAGTGYVGLVSAAMGARVDITDLPEFTKLMEYNVEKNLDVINYLHGHCTAKELVWGSVITEKAHLVLIADCIYYDDALLPLVKTMVDLSTPETLIICCHEERTTDNKPRIQKQFFEEVGKYFQVVNIPSSMQHPSYNSEDIHINVFQLKDPKS